MRAFFASLKPSLIILTILTLVLGIGYPFLMWGVGQLLFPKEVQGSLFYYKDGKVIGSELIGQNFRRPEYFHPRPSSAGNAGYDASNSSASNFGPTSKAFIKALEGRVGQYRKENNLAPSVIIPADAVTGSGSGLDPHISIANALLQAGRVAGQRGLAEREVKDLIEKYKERPTFGLFGTERVNVLVLNLALDKVSP
jgi:K+-transporting ATPase ATPase C chain